jgi:hypothetical protein
VTTSLQVRANEHGVVRLFAIDLSPEQAKQFGPVALSATLGGTSLDRNQVDILNIAELEDIGLAGYLTSGMGISDADVSDALPQLSTLSGHVALVRSAAFKGRAATLTPKAPLRWVASFGETPMDLTAEHLGSGHLGRRSCPQGQRHKQNSAYPPPRSRLHHIRNRDYAARRDPLKRPASWKIPKTPKCQAASPP